MNDPEFGPVPRYFAVEAPTGYSDTTPLGPNPLFFWRIVCHQAADRAVLNSSGLFLYFHGQFGYALPTAAETTFNQYGQELGFMSVFPQGLANEPGVGLSLCGTGWNTEANGDTDTCLPDTSGECCYNSCRDLGKCTTSDKRCSWSTCYDDVHFVDTLIDYLGDRACIDLDAVFVGGASNGGILSFAIAHRLPHKIKAILPCIGLPLVNHGDRPPPIAYLGLFGSEDEVVPIDGKPSRQGWIYESAADMAAAYATANKCSKSTIIAETPVDKKEVDFSCVEHPNCAGSAKVLSCTYRRGHVPPRNHVGEELTAWFLKDYLNRTNTRLAVSVVDE